MTDDHVPPKNLFLSPRPSDLITVPACQKCNHESHLDDEYFRVFAVTPDPKTSIGQQIWREKVVQSTFARSPSLRNQMSRDVFTAELKTPAGLHLGHAPMLRFDGKRIERVLTRIVRGICWYRMRERISLDATFVIPRTPNEDPEILEVLRAVPSWKDGDGSVFRYAFAVQNDDWRYQLWWLVFYERHLVQIGVGPADEPPPTESA